MSAIQPRRAQARSAQSVESVHVTEAALEAGKWLALIAMTLDHVNTYVLQGAYPWMYQVGRLAMPLFGIVLAAHLAAPDALAPGGRAARMTRRLLLYGLLAQMPFTLLRGGPWPPTLFNTMLLMLLVVAFLQLSASKRPDVRIGAWLLLVAGGAVVEFWWIGAAVILCARAWLIRPDADRTYAALLAFALLCVLTMSPVPLLAPIAIWVLHRARLGVPRLRGAFYVYYPVHFAVLVAVVGIQR